MNDFIIIPAHHEQNTIARVIQQAKQYTPNIIVVDDGSRDQTRSIARRIAWIRRSCGAEGEKYR